MKVQEKTNAMRRLAALKISYQSYEYDQNRAVSGIQVAGVLGQNPEQVFKTLVTTGKSGHHYVFLVPVAGELDLKKAARAVGEKAVEMLPQKELLGLTGYVHGGCSPIGMKKNFPTVIHRSAADFPAIIFSGGKIGLQIELPLEQLERVVPFTLADLI